MSIFKRTIKILVLAFGIALLITSCNPEVNESPAVKPDISMSPVQSPGITPNPSQDNNQSSISPNSEIPDDIVEADHIKIIYTADSTGKYYGLSDWQTYIHEKFGIEIYVDYQSLSADSINKENLIIDGILYLKYHETYVSSYNTEVLQLSNDDFAYDLLPYYEKYEWDEFIEKQYIDALNVDGSIYAVPAADVKYIVPRFYNTSYLDELDSEVPETIAQFHEYLLATKDLNSSDDTFYPMVIFPLHTPSTADIFRAFGVYFNSMWNNARTFNPNTNSFEDGVFSENIEEAVGFIRQLQNENLLMVYDIFGETVQGVFSKEMATEYNVVYDIGKYGFSQYIMAESAYERTNGYFLTHTNISNVCEIRKDLAFYMFPKTIENINGTVELFNRFFTDSEYYADLRYGIENIDYFVIDGIPVKHEPKTGVLLNLKPIKPVRDINSSFAPDSVSIAQYISATLAYESNVFNQKWTYSGRGANRDINHDNSIEVLFDKELSPYDAIEKYWSDFIKEGKLSILNELNERIGAVPVYNYGN